MHSPTDGRPPLSKEAPVPSPPPAARPCPICAAPLIHLRGQDRCSRCRFTFCVGCDGGPE